jgi:two-component system, sensor histidine kinase
MTTLIANQQPDPEDIGYSNSTFWSLRGSEALVASLFLASLPWWQPVTWLLLVSGSGIYRDWRIRQPSFRALPLIERRYFFRWSIWLRMGFGGCSCFLLYVPGNVVMIVLLGFCMLCSAVLATLRVAGDFTRAVGAVSLVLLPLSFRMIFDGFQNNVFISLLGVGGIFLALTVIFMSRIQERALTAQFELRQRAELATDALASVGLAKARFFAAVSHDLRQPVHAIGLYLDPLIKLSRGAQDPDAQRAAEGIRQCWRALDDLLSQVLDLTRMDSGALQADIESVELAPLVRDLIMQHSAVAERAGIRLIALIHAGKYALADTLMLKRVLSNLLDNAIKFSPAGKPVVIALRSVKSHWHLQVRDAGIGIASEEQDKIFEEFVQLNNEERDRKRGLGLGLAICKRFSLLMGGDVRIRSALGAGTCMTVELKKAQETSKPRPRSNDLALNRDPQVNKATGDLDLAFQSKDVLLIEDDPLVANAMVHLLSSWHLNVRHVDNATDAMLQVDFGQIAICDVRLPDGASGIDVALAMRERGKKVLLITGETDLAVRNAALQHGMPLLIKPVSSTKLLKAIQAL